jgi:hypothetical protein
LLTLVAAPTLAETALHDLPAENRDPVAAAIQTALGANCTNRQINCSATPLPNGQLLVEAPADVHEELANVLKAIAERAPKSAETVRTTLQYWALAATAGAPDADNQSLQPLQPVLAQLERLHGPLGFEVADRAALTIVSSGNGNTGWLGRGRGASIRGVSGGDGGLSVTQQTAQLNESEMRGRVSLTFAPPRPSQGAETAAAAPFNGVTCGGPCSAVSMEVEMTLQRGEFLVLGERTLPGSQGQSLFYVVHWPESE